MLQKQNNAMSRRGWIEISLTTVIALILSVLGPFALLFMLPLQVLAFKSGKEAFLFSAAGIIFGSFVLRMILIPDDIEGIGVMIFTGMVIIIFLISGLYAVNFMFTGFRFILKLCVVTAIIGLLSIPVLYYLNSNQSFNSIMNEQIDNTLVILGGVLEENTEDLNDALLYPDNSEESYAFYRTNFLNFFLVIYFIFLALTWRLGNRIGFRSIVNFPRPPKIKEFYVPEKLVWFYIVPLAISLLKMLFGSKDMVFDPGLVGYAVSNTLYVMGILYALQGFGLLQYLMDKRKISLRYKLIIGSLLVVSFFISYLGLIFVFILSVLGVSELWINYRRNNKELIQ